LCAWRQGKKAHPIFQIPQDQIREEQKKRPRNGPDGEKNRENKLGTCRNLQSRVDAIALVPKTLLGTVKEYLTGKRELPPNNPNVNNLELG